MSARPGSAAEDAAARYLLQLGWTLVGRRLRSGPAEFDLVAFEDQTLVVVEVKLRRRGDAEAALDADKAQRLHRGLDAYLADNQLSDRPARIDLITFGPEGLRHFRNAVPGS